MLTLAATAFAAMGPAAAADDSRAHRTGRITPLAESFQAPSLSPGEADGGQTSVMGGNRLLRVTGRLVFVTTNQAGQSGVDNIFVEVRDDDTIGHSVLWSGYTDTTGVFDTGVVDISDDDHEPDLYIYVAADTPIVSVQDGSAYDWSTFDTLLVDDFTGDYFTFGVLQLNDADLIPAIDAHQVITRAHNFVLNAAGINIGKVLVNFPAGDDFGYDYDGEIVLGEFHYLTREVLHQYAHHIESDLGMAVAAGNACDNQCRYCQGITSCGIDTTRCVACPTTPAIARSEGFALWFQQAVNLHMQQNYQFDTGEPFNAVIDSSAEWFPPQVWPEPEPPNVYDLTDAFNDCGEDILENGHRSAWVVQAFLEDLADNIIDDHEGDNIRDCAGLGHAEVLAAYLQETPGDILQFIDALIARTPERTSSLYATALNMSPALADRFPEDSEPPGEVPNDAATSATHDNPGADRSLPCIFLTVQTPLDDVTGGCAFSIEWSDQPDVVPDTIAEVTGTCPEIVSPALPPGDYYACVRVQDCAGHWSNQTNCLGPYTIDDCNGNGFPDVCDIVDATWDAVDGCEISPDFCLGAPPPTEGDCDMNLVPDACDVANGAEDCNLNGRPDGAPCEVIAHWNGGSGNWADPINWDLNDVPPGGAHACIGGLPADATVTIDQDEQCITNFACYENLTVQSTTFPWPTLEFIEDSYVFGDLTLGGNNARISHNGTLDIHGFFHWQDEGRLSAFGTTFARGGVHLSGRGWLDPNHTFELGAGHFLSTGVLRTQTPSYVRIHQGTVYEVQSNGYTIYGSGGTLINEGLFVRTAGNDNATLTCQVENTGVIRVESGTLAITGGGSNTGRITGLDGTTLLIGPGLTFGENSILEGDSLEVGYGGGNLHVRGVYDVSTQTYVYGSSLVIEPDTDLVDIGDTVTIDLNKRLTINLVDVPSIDIDFLNMVDGFMTVNNSYRLNIRNFNFGPGESQVSGDMLADIHGHLNYMGGSDILADGELNIYGTATIHPSNQSRSLSVDVTNHGYMLFAGGLGFNNSATFHNTSAGTIEITGDHTVFPLGSAPFINDGGVARTSGTGTSNVGIPVANRGSFEVLTGDMVFTRSLSQTSGLFHVAEGEISYNPSYGGPFDIKGGIFRGNVTVTGGLIAGDCDTPPCTARIMPGDGIGQLHVTEDLTLHEGAVMEIQLGAADTYDVVEVGGTLALNGSIHVELLGGYVPDMGDAFHVLRTTGTPTGSITVTGPGSWDAVIDDTGVTLVNQVAPCGAQHVGDVDHNCLVDLADLQAIVECMTGPESQAPLPCLNADVDANGTVDLADVHLLQLCFMDDGRPVCLP